MQTDVLSCHVIFLMQLANTDRLVTDLISVDLENVCYSFILFLWFEFCHDLFNPTRRGAFKAPSPEQKWRF